MAENMKGMKSPNGWRNFRKRYEGRKLCTECNEYYPNDLRLCPVHKRLMRTRPRGSKNKEKYLEALK